MNWNLTHRATKFSFIWDIRKELRDEAMAYLKRTGDADGFILIIRGC